MTHTHVILRPPVFFAAAILLGAMALSSCGSSDIPQSLTAEERFEIGRQKYAEGDFLEATNDFQMVKLQFPASSVADDAQYFLAECHFAREEFLLASEEYQSLRRLMASSPYAVQSQYKIALCFYNLSPRSSLDQTYSRKAIEEFQSFIEDYRSDSLVAPAAAKIKELNTRLAQKLFETAEVYEKLEYNKSATIYYDMVVEQYHDTEFAEPALLMKARVLVTRKKYGDARSELEKFFTRYPTSPLRDEAESLRASIEALAQPASSALSPTPAAPPNGAH